MRRPRALFVAACIGVVATTTVEIKTFASTDCSGSDTADLKIESEKCNKV